MILTSDRMSLRLALIGAVAAALVLGGCGRKGPLDAPPGASAEAKAAAAADAEAEAAAPGNNGLVRKGGSRGLPTVKGQKKTIPLDVLLD